MLRGRVFDAEIIELCVRWYITYRLSYRDPVAMMAERGGEVAHSTILSWVTWYVPEFEKRGLRVEADRLCGRIGILAGGRLTAEGTPKQLKTQIAIETGAEPTLESVFMKYTGRSLDDDIEEGETDPTD